MASKLQKTLITITSLAVVAGTIWYFAFRGPGITDPNFGKPVDSLNGVIVYYNGAVGNVSERNVAPDGYNIGLQYQCVEFVKRYYYEHYKHKMPDSYGHALSFFDATLSDSTYSPKRDLFQFKNGSKSKPQIGDLLIYDGHTGNPYGHVAIISNVSDNTIEIIQQNPGPNGPSRATIELSNINNKWTLSQNRILGWLRKQE